LLSRLTDRRLSFFNTRSERFLLESRAQVVIL
jgi:hypothetical protein